LAVLGPDLVAKPSPGSALIEPGMNVSSWKMVAKPPHMNFKAHSKDRVGAVRTSPLVSSEHQHSNHRP
jgi:hypothetical protein